MDHQFLIDIIQKGPSTNVLSYHQNIPQQLLNLKQTTKRLGLEQSFHIDFLIQNRPPNGHMLFIVIIQKGPSTECVWVLGTKLFHSAFLIENGPPNGPSALYCHKTKETSNQMCYLRTYIYILLSFHITFQIQDGSPALYCHDTTGTSNQM